LPLQNAARAIRAVSSGTGSIGNGRIDIGSLLQEVPCLNTPISPNDQQYQNWRARPLTSRLAVVELIAATTTKTGLTVACAEDTTDYRKGIKVTDDEMESLAITRDELHPQWNYTISPRKSDRAVILA
jgi:hypothetical protein